jgi:dynactin complex subunit
VWVGVELEERAVGGHDGQFPHNGGRYFSCGDGFGLYCSGASIRAHDTVVQRAAAEKRRADAKAISALPAAEQREIRRVEALRGKSVLIKHGLRHEVDAEKSFEKCVRQTDSVSVPACPPSWHVDSRINISASSPSAFGLTDTASPTTFASPTPPHHRYDSNHSGALSRDEATLLLQDMFMFLRLRVLADFWRDEARRL